MIVTSVSFPYGESIQWLSPHDNHALPNNALKHWLLGEGSLTQKLKARCQDFTVTVLGEHIHTPLAGEFPDQSLGHLQSQPDTQAPLQKMWIREVLLSLDGTPWVFARTLVPHELIDHPIHAFAQLGNRPLGELLYSSDEIIPGKIEVAQFESCGNLAQLASSLKQTVSGSLWGRRRYFSLDDNDLIVCEIFLPAAVNAILTTAETASIS